LVGGLAAGYNGWVEEAKEVVFGSNLHFGGGLGCVGDVTDGTEDATAVVSDDDEVFVRVGREVFAMECDGIDEAAVDKDVDLMEAVIEDEVVPFL